LNAINKGNWDVVPRLGADLVDSFLKSDVFGILLSKFGGERSRSVNELLDWRVRVLVGLFKLLLESPCLHLSSLLA
jgi:hypothetical protein